VLCFYLLPAFAAVLKIRAKKLSQIGNSSGTDAVVNKSTSNSLFFDNLITKLTGISFYRNNLVSDINTTYSYLLFKNDAFSQFNFTMLNQFKIVTLFY
jgi:hypothetical protein